MSKWDKFWDIANPIILISAVVLQVLEGHYMTAFWAGVALAWYTIYRLERKLHEIDVQILSFGDLTSRR